jgi:hypothetical protein
MAKDEDYLCLKWGTLKRWNLTSEKGRDLLRRYFELGSYMSAVMQHDSAKQKELICQMIDECGAETIHLGWDNVDVSKEDAKRYVMEYGVKPA